MRYTSILSLACCMFLAAERRSLAAEPSFVRELDLIYHKQDGYALTLDRVAPQEDGNGAAIILVMSGGWFSNHDLTKPHEEQLLPNVFKSQAEELLDRGYTLFYVVHATQPKFTVREILGQLSAAVRYVRHHAEEFQIEADRIGIMGGSAGGHLSLMQGTTGGDGMSDGDDAADESSRVQAVVAYFPPTDFVNYGSDDVFFDKVVREVIPGGANPFLPALEWVEFDSENFRFLQVTDEKRLAEHYRAIAPLYHVTPDDAPTLLLHGDADRLVPMQQSELIRAKFKQSNVPVELFVKEGGNHGWSSTEEEIKMVADWFDKYLVAQ